jgi:hypothetical protein
MNKNNINWEIPPIDPKRVRVIDGEKRQFTAIENSFKKFADDLDPIATQLYRHLVAYSNKYGMACCGMKQLVKYLARNKKKIATAFEELKSWGLIIQEKTSEGILVQILEVPDYDLMKKRHLNFTKLQEKKTYTPAEVAESLKAFDNQIFDPSTSPATVELLKRMKQKFLQEVGEQETTQNCQKVRGKKTLKETLAHRKM